MSFNEIASPVRKEFEMPLDPEAAAFLNQSSLLKTPPIDLIPLWVIPRALLLGIGAAAGSDLFPHWPKSRIGTSGVLMEPNCSFESTFRGQPSRWRLLPPSPRPCGERGRVRGFSLFLRRLLFRLLPHRTTVPNRYPSAFIFTAADGC